MPPTSDLDPLGQLFEGQFKLAWSLFLDLKYDQANSLCHELLAEPRIGDLHRAGLHVILAHSPHDYVWHAAEAVRIYEQMYTDQEPTESQLDSKKELLRSAKAVQAKALADKKALDDAVISEEEEREWIQQVVDDLAEEDLRLAQDMEMDLEDVQDTTKDEEVLEGAAEDQQLDMAVKEASEGEVEMVVGEVNEDEVNMLAPMREEPATEGITVEQTMSTISATDKRTIEEGMKFGAATGLATPAASRTTSGQPGAPRRSSRLTNKE